MKHMTYLFALCALMAGCAGMDAAGDNEQGYEEKVTVTGSNIPRRKDKNVEVYNNKEDLERAMRPMVITTPGATPGR